MRPGPLQDLLVEVEDALIVLAIVVYYTGVCTHDLLVDLVLSRERKAQRRHDNETRTP